MLLELVSAELTASRIKCRCLQTLAALAKVDADAVWVAVVTAAPVIPQSSLQPLPHEVKPSGQSTLPDVITFTSL